MDMISKYGFGRIGLIIIPVVGLVTAITISFGALGEEIGWRSYMYPKLEEMFGLKKAILIGGIIWGVWHYPLVAVGHIGTGYMGEPYTGFIVFTIDCIFVGCMTYLLVKKTGSIWPAVFLHAFNNTGADPIIMCLNPDKVNGIFKDGLIVQVINVIGVIIVGIVALKLFDKNETNI